MFNRLVKRATLGPLCLVFLVVPIWLLSLSAHAQTQPQRGLEGKNILVVHSFESNVPVFLETDKGRFRVRGRVQNGAGSLRSSIRGCCFGHCKTAYERYNLGY